MTHARERHFIKILQATLEKEKYEKVVLGIGDDAAVLGSLDKHLVCSVDVQVEHVHFKQSYLSHEQLAWRAMAVSVSDLSAMAAKPVGALVSLILPESTSDETIRALAEGLRMASDEMQIPVVGGNLSRGRNMSVSVTVLGESNSNVLRRSTAKVGDKLYLTGQVGSAALGLKALQQSSTHLDFRKFVERWQRPPVYLKEMAAVAHIASAAIDLSDGLNDALQLVTESSHVAATVALEKLPFDTGYREACEALDCDPFELALLGGEDYELLIASKEHPLLESFATCIGDIVVGDKNVMYTYNGSEQPTVRQGDFVHFA
ncbi:MAG: thiamine-phosphate kinase [Myxococcales bacterium]|nr:MAG: thiamine-phosphate kinase [Myxococcales bacterium]